MVHSFHLNGIKFSRQKRGSSFAMFDILIIFVSIFLSFFLLFFVLFAFSVLIKSKIEPN